MTSDEALMAQFQAGSRVAFEELFTRYHQPLYGFFRRRLNNQERAEDLVQETFLAVIRAASRYEPRALFRAFLYGIGLKLVAADRRGQHRQSETLSEDLEQSAVTPADSTIWVRRALEKLDPSEREILMLREYEQLSYSEIADLLCIPVNTVRSRLFRARMELKNQLSEKRRSRPRSGEASDIRENEACNGR